MHGLLPHTDDEESISLRVNPNPTNTESFATFLGFTFTNTLSEQEGVPHSSCLCHCLVVPWPARQMLGHGDLAPCPSHGPALWMP